MVRDKVLRYLEQNRGQIVTGGKIAKRLNVSRTAIWKAINSLREEGHSIESIPNSGYRLLDNSDGLIKESISDSLETFRFGRSLEILNVVDSTNSYIRSLDLASLSEGFTVLADEQTAGKGRYGRGFCSPSHEGIYMSMLLKPVIPPADVPMLTICAAVAVSEALENICHMDVGIKWVNDIYCDGKKICGILSEAMMSAELNVVEYAIIGIGVNTGKIGREVSDIATSVYEISGLSGIRNRLAAEILNRFEKSYDEYATESDSSSIIDKYRKRLFILNKKVDVLQNDKLVYQAVVRDINDRGALLAIDDDGVEHVLNSGEIRIRYEEQKNG